MTLGLFLPATVVASGHTSRVILALFIGVTMCVSAIPVIANVVLVALVTSIMAPPVLRHAMSQITQTDEEPLRKINHDPGPTCQPAPGARIAAATRAACPGLEVTGPPLFW